jgi:hypothetical protein
MYPVVYLMSFSTLYVSSGVSDDPSVYVSSGVYDVRLVYCMYPVGYLLIPQYTVCIQLSIGVHNDPSVFGSSGVSEDTCVLWRICTV